MWQILTVISVLGTLQSRFFELNYYISKKVNIKSRFECFAKLARKEKKKKSTEGPKMMEC